MKAKATQPFNAHGIIAEKEGQELTIDNAIVFAQLENIGFIKEVESKKSKTSKHKD
jgi:hypothetical protein